MGRHRVKCSCPGRASGLEGLSALSSSLTYLGQDELQEPDNNGPAPPEIPGLEKGPKQGSLSF